MVLLDAGTARTSTEIYSEDADGETQTHKHWIANSLLWPLSYIAQNYHKKQLSLSSWCIASLYIYHFSTQLDFSSEKYSSSTGHRESWYD